MELGQGEIYFVTEQEGAGRSEFAKIGLVGDAEGRSSLSRMKEHQTGNPRELQLHHVVKTVFVTTVESRLHSEYASRRVSGEWFRLDDSALMSAVTRCQTLAQEYEREIPVFEEADRLSLTPSIDELTVETPESQGWREKHAAASRGEAILTDATERLRSYFKRLHGEGVDVLHVAKISERQGTRSFDADAFKALHPDLWALYQVTRTKISSSGLRVTAMRELPGEDLGLEDAEGLSARLLSGIESSASTHEALGNLHDTYLELIGLQPLYTEQKALASAHLKVLCGERSGIENVCTWKRTLKEETKLDEAAIKEIHPEKYLACTSVGAPRVTVNILRRSRTLEQPQDEPEV
jgi:hypothetical protein